MLLFWRPVLALGEGVVSVFHIYCLLVLSSDSGVARLKERLGFLVRFQ
uniref:Uncharacterized protein n=1 Tax=Anguilla anguilla TaxID=7936 RepID=A0A0E9Y175_ANGAN